MEDKIFLAKKVWNSKLTFIKLSENPQNYGHTGKKVSKIPEISNRHEKKKSMEF